MRMLREALAGGRLRCRDGCGGRTLHVIPQLEVSLRPRGASEQFGAVQRIVLLQQPLHLYQHNGSTIRRCSVRARWRLAQVKLDGKVDGRARLKQGRRATDAFSGLEAVEI